MRFVRVPVVSVGDVLVVGSSAIMVSFVIALQILQAGTDSQVTAT